MSNVIYKDYKNEYLERYNETGEFLKNLLWNIIFLKYGKQFLNTNFPKSTIPVIERICNDIKIVSDMRIKNLLDEEKGILKSLENAMLSTYVHKSYRNKFINSLKDLSWNTLSCTKEKLLTDRGTIKDAEDVVKASYEYFEKMAFDDACTLNYTEIKNRYEWFAEYFFNLNDKHSHPIMLVM